MTNAVRDENHIPVKLAISTADNVTTLPLQVDPTTHLLRASDGVSDIVTGTSNIAERDGDHVTTLMAVSSADGVTPIPLYIDSATNRLLVKST